MEGRLISYLSRCIYGLFLGYWSSDSVVFVFPFLLGLGTAVPRKSRAVAGGEAGVWTSEFEGAVILGRVSGASVRKMAGEVAEERQNSSYRYWVRETTTEAAPLTVPKKLSVEDLAKQPPQSAALGSVWNRVGHRIESFSCLLTAKVR